MRTAWCVVGLLSSCLAIAAVLVGCEGGGDSGEGTPVDIAGTWKGTYTIAGYGSYNCVVRLTQDGKNVSGTVQVEQSIPVTGVVEGNRVSLTIGKGAVYEANVEGTVDGNTMNLTGSDRDGHSESYQLTRS